MYCVYCGAEIANKEIAQPVCDFCFFKKRKEILEKGQIESQQGFSFSGVITSFTVGIPSNQPFEIPTAYFIYSDRTTETKQRLDSKKEVPKRRMIRFRKSKRMIRSDLGL